MNLPKAVFLGFFPKITEQSPEWLDNQSVREICSVSECISKGPENWIQKWQHNELGFFDSESLAYEVIEQHPEKFDIYAYKLFPLRCLGDELEFITLESRFGHQLPKDYQFLGYDIVTKSVADFFECSPLSCNHGAKQYNVNQFCLVDDQAGAMDILLEISKDGSYEPGPYYLFEVYRKKK